MECSEYNQNSLHSMNELYYRNMKNISEGDLKFVEKDLAFYEKISLSFLLFGGDRINAQYALQRLLVLENNQNDDSDILYSFSKSTPDWRNPLIEALAIIGANKILRKLGFSILDLKIILLPHIPEVSLFIHPVLKALFIVCERLDSAEAGRLVLEINMNKTSNFIRFYKPHLLEVYLLDWLTKNFISIGDCSDTAVSKPNLDLITQFLKMEEMDTLKEILDNVVKNFNKPLNNTNPTTNMQPGPSYNENDSVASANEKFQKNDTYETKLEHYSIRKEWAGFILIINQKKFNRDTNPEFKNQLSEVPLKPRRGSDVDRDKLKTTFASFGYNPVEIDNCSHIKMKNIIKDFVNRSVFYDSLIICILSHGIEGAVYGADSVPVRIQTIQKIMAADFLQNKPKMLIIQACQEKKTHVSTVDHGTMGPDALAYGDMLTAVATIPGFASFRHTVKGTWFIQTLCNLVDQFGDRKHMLDILTAVSNEVGGMRGDDNECMIPQYLVTLKKSLFLPKRF